MNVPDEPSGASTPPIDSLSSMPASPDDSNQTTRSETASQFGLIDIIEAFTAMRHEFRTRSKHDLELADRLQSGVLRIDELESTLTDAVRQAFDATPDAETLKRLRLAETLADIDAQLSRSADQLHRALEADSTDDSTERTVRDKVDRVLRQAGPVKRFFCRGFADRMVEELTDHSSRRAGELRPLLEGLVMMADRVKQSIAEAGVRRVDVVGKPFDPECMFAVENMATGQVPPGHVLRQLSPAYRYDGRVLRFAQVHVARSPESSTHSTDPI